MKVVKRRLKKLWYSVFCDHPYTYPGRFLIRLLPESRKLRFYDENFSFQPPSNLIANMVRIELIRQHHQRSDQEIRSLNREKLWGAAASKRRLDVKHEQFQGTEALAEERATLLSQLQELLAVSPSYHTICEVGTGHGAFLNLMSSRYTLIKRYVGFDLNRELILENQETYIGTALEFVEGEVTDWIDACCGGGIIFVVWGVLE